MRTLITLFVLFFLSTSLYCFAQADTASANWKIAKFKNISFRYPNDWVFEKQEIPGNAILTDTPVILRNRSSMKYFEIICVNPHGHTYSDFKKEFIGGIAARSEGGIKVNSQKDTTFKKLAAVYAKIDIIGDKNAIPASVFAINGKDKFYLITILSFKERDSVAVELDKTTEAILSSVNLNNDFH